MTRKMCLPLGVKLLPWLQHVAFCFSYLVFLFPIGCFYYITVFLSLLLCCLLSDGRREENKKKEKKKKERERECDHMIVWWLEAILLIHSRVRSHVWTWWRMLHFTRMFWILTWMASEFTLDGLPWKKPDLKKMMARGMDCFQESSLLPSKIVSLFS